MKKSLLMVMVSGVISAIPILFNMDIGIDFYKNGFVLYNEAALVKLIEIVLLSAFVATALYFRSKTATTNTQEENNLQIEADVKGRCNLPTHLHCKKN